IPFNGHDSSTKYSDPILALLLIQATAHALSLAKPGCQERCGNVVIPYPFGVGADCSNNETFAIACNSSFSPAKPFLNAINMEVLEISLQGTIRVNNPISTSNCPNRPDSTLKMDMSKTPFSFSDSQSKFTAMGCNNLALINGKDVETGGCTSFCNSSWRPSTCYGINCCQTRIPSSLKVIDVSLTRIYSNNGVESCKRAFMVEQNWFANLTNPFDVHFMENVPVVLDWKANATCKNFTERYIKDQYKTVCACGWGREGNPYLVNGCQDIDECADGSAKCTYPYVCVNTPGGYGCFLPNKSSKKARAAIIATIQAASLAKPGCQEKCGDITIPFPFGIGANCSGDEGYAISCDTKFSPAKAFISSINLEVLEISLANGSLRVNNPVLTSNCPDKISSILDLDLSASPFSFSDTDNRFTAMGCDNLALINRQATTIGGCMSFCNITSRDNTCYGINCCQTRIPPFLKFINASLGSIDRSNDQIGCKYAFMVDQDWFTNLTDPYVVQRMDNVPVVLNSRPYGVCRSFGAFNSATNSSESLCRTQAFCTNQSLCSCNPGYDGNPYLPDGCQDVDECASSLYVNLCLGTGCVNTNGSYFCACPHGYTYRADPTFPGSFRSYTCYKQASGNTRKMAIIGTSAGLGLLLLLVGIWWSYKIMKKRKKAKLKEKFFKRNGGLLLRQQMSSGDANVENTKLFTSKELGKATDHYNDNRILGQGGQGTVYKGMLTDGRIVAVKKSKIEDEGQLKHFINEVVILSQINHRNVVKLHGCCLETEVPLLVYEFIPNGTLYQYIHDKSEEFPLSWPTMKEVAMELEGIRMSNAAPTPQQTYEEVAYSMNEPMNEPFGPWDTATLTASPGNLISRLRQMPNLC
ncbi:hypothetical protein RJ639_016128, partial [Escallonia herrerae]